MALICIFNGPNLNLLGKRQPQIYGHETLSDIEANCRRVAAAHGHDLEMFQSNSEGQLVDKIHEARERAAAIVINAGGYTHTSIAVLDALNAFEGVVIEVHISNVHRRESFRHHSYISLRADGIIIGCGTQGYELALERLARTLGA